MNAWRIFTAVAAVLTVAAIAWYFLLRNAPHHSDATLAHQVAVIVPDLAGQAISGANVFARACASCHGTHAAGGPGGPPLVHKIYEPSHHADGAFMLAVRNGVRQHHWQFGSMPPVAGVSPAETASIIHYVRTLQRANGIR